MLHMGHHGSESATNQTFINRVLPDVAVLSCGYDSQYGHPHIEPLQRLAYVVLMGQGYHRIETDGEESFDASLMNRFQNWDCSEPLVRYGLLRHAPNAGNVPPVLRVLDIPGAR